MGRDFCVSGRTCPQGGEASRDAVRATLGRVSLSIWQAYFVSLRPPGRGGFGIENYHLQGRTGQVL